MGQRFSISRKWDSLTWDKVADPYFNLTSCASFVVLVLSTVLALFVYCGLISWRQEALLDAYKNADIICDQLADDPTLPPSWCDFKIDKGWSKRHSLSLAHIAKLMEDAEIIKKDRYKQLTDILDANRFPESAFALGVLASNEALLDPPLINNDDAVNSPTLKWIAQLTMLYRNKCTPNEKAGEIVEVDLEIPIIDILANGMSGVTFKESISDVTRLIIKDDGNTSCLAPPATPYGLVFDVSEDRRSDGAILSSLWNQLGLRNGNGDKRAALMIGSNRFVLSTVHNGKLTVGRPIANPGQAQLEKGLNGIEKLSLHLMSQIHESPSVKSKRTWLVMFRGVEQALMLILTFVVGFVFLIRFRCRRLLEKVSDDINNSIGKADIDQTTTPETWRSDMMAIFAGLGGKDGILARPSVNSALRRLCSVVLNKLRHPLEDDVSKIRSEVSNISEHIQNTRWLLKWAAYTIPALGFIGTVRGILNSLGDAGSIVYASTTAERGEAINALAGQLGLSFSTTFIALVIGIGISWINDRQETKESDFMLRLEGILVQAVDFRTRQQNISEK